MVTPSMQAEDTRAWVPSKSIDGEWLEARVVSTADADGKAAAEE